MTKDKTPTRTITPEVNAILKEIKAKDNLSLEDLIAYADKRSIKRSTDVTPRTDAWLREQKEKHGRSLGDLIEWLAENYELKEMNNDKKV